MLADIEAVLAKLIVSASDESAAEINGGEGVEAIEAEPGTVDCRRKATDRSTRISPIVPSYPSQVEVIQIVIWIADDALSEEVQMCLTWEMSRDRNVQCIIMDSPIFTDQTDHCFCPCACNELDDYEKGMRVCEHDEMKCSNGIWADREVSELSCFHSVSARIIQSYMCERRGSTLRYDAMIAVRYSCALDDQE